MRLTLTHHPDGATTARGAVAATYDLVANEASFGAASVMGPALVWELHDGEAPPRALLSAPVELDRATPWLMRCDRVDFPPGAIAHRHTHPGPGIRCQLFGELTVETEGRTGTYGPLEPWFESGPEPVLATATAAGDSAFVRVMLLPAEWLGKRTIRYVDPADAERPKLQRATVFFDEPVPGLGGGATGRTR